MVTIIIVVGKNCNFVKQHQKEKLVFNKFKHQFAIKADPATFLLQKRTHYRKIISESLYPLINSLELKNNKNQCES